MRQRLSAESDRYRGRRRVPTPPRARYAAVVTGAFVGAGIVALGASAMPDAKAADATVLAGLQQSAATGGDLSSRADDAARASRHSDRAALDVTATQDGWALPLHDYDLMSPYGERWGAQHVGVDLAAPEGTPFQAVHSGTVVKAGWYGGYGYAVIIRHADGTEAIYGHSSKLLVHEGQQVKTGDQIGLVGNTGHSYGSHLHIEIQVDGAPTDPIAWLNDRGVDIKLKTESPFLGG